MPIDKTLTEYLGQFDSAFDRKSYIDINLLKKNLSGTRYRYGYDIPNEFTELLVSLIEREGEEVTKQDVINLGLSIHGLSLNDLGRETEYLDVLNGLNKVADQIEFYGPEKEHEVTARLAKESNPITLHRFGKRAEIPKEYGQPFDLSLRDRIDGWDLVLSYAGGLDRRSWSMYEEMEETFGTELVLNVINVTRGEKSILEYLRRKLIAELAENSSLSFTVGMPTTHYRDEEKSFTIDMKTGKIPYGYWEDPQEKTIQIQETAYDTILETLRTMDDTKIYNPEELVKGFNGLRSFKITYKDGVNLEVSVSNLEGRSVVAYTEDISRESWDNLKELAAEGLRAVA